jgi:hypothetical protein
MNEETSGGRRPRRRPAVRRRAGALPAAVAVIAMLATACGGGSPASASAPGGSSYQHALAFAQCMRSHGESGYPDPTKEAGNSVAFKITPASGIHTGSAQYQSAYGTCQKLLPAGHRGLTPALLQKGLSALLKYSECMRSHGIANFPDPVSNGKGISIPAVTGVDPQSPQFQSAQQACRSLMPGGAAAP